MGTAYSDFIKEFSLELIAVGNRASAVTGYLRNQEEVTRLVLLGGDAVLNRQLWLSSSTMGVRAAQGVDL